MRKAPLIISILCLAGIAYGYWGAFTLSGQKHYDEMDAMYPFFCLVGSVIVLVITLIAWLILALKKR